MAILVTTNFGLIFIPFALMGFLLSAICLLDAFIFFRRSLSQADTVESNIRGLSMGLVGIHGKAEGDETLLSPITHTPCFCYKITWA